MAWIVLILAGMLEAVWATALEASSGFRRPRPTVLFAVALVLSMAGLALAMQSLPTGTAYAVWAGTGAFLTVAWGIVSGRERVSLARVALLGVLVCSIVGLKLVS